MSAINYSIIPGRVGLIAVLASLIFGMACTVNGGVAREVQDTEPAMKLSAYQLLGDYLADEADADLKYKNKIVLVDGVIDRFVSGIEPKVYFAGGNGLTELSCGLDSREGGKLVNQRMGQEVTFKGKVTGKGPFHVELQGCIIQDQASVKSAVSTFPMPTSTPPPAPTLVPQNMIIEGSQGLITEAFYLKEGAVTFATTYRGGPGSAITVHLRSSEGEDVELIAYGRILYRSPKAVYIDKPGYYILEIEAGDGVWSIVVE